MPKLRGHHLICLQFFVGKGYSRRFVRNTLKVLREKDRITIVDGLDDVCRAYPYNTNGRCSNPRTSNERIWCLDRLALSLLSAKVGSRINWDEVRRKLPKVLPIWIKRACKGCRWWKICKNEMLKFKC